MHTYIITVFFWKEGKLHKRVDEAKAESHKEAMLIASNTQALLETIGIKCPGGNKAELK